MPNASQDGPPDGYVTSADACTRLGISDRTLRRRVAAGTIEGEYLPRPQGTVLYVRLPEDAAMQTAIRGTSVKTQEMAYATQISTEAAVPPPAATEPPALTTSLLEMVKADRETIAAQAETIAELRERVGRAEERAERLLAEKEQWALDVMEQTDRAVRAEAELQRLRGRRWYDWLRGR